MAAARQAGGHADRDGAGNLGERLSQRHDLYLVAGQLSCLLAGTGCDRLDSLEHPLTAGPAGRSATARDMAAQIEVFRAAATSLQLPER